jgi:hypothetical protein
LAPGPPVRREDVKVYPMPDEAPLREFARFAIRTGRLPRREPARIWGGPGVGGFCGVCEKPISQDELEYELEFACHDDNPKRDKVHPQRDKVHFHLRCFAAWEFERTKPAN